MQERGSCKYVKGKVVKYKYLQKVTLAEIGKTVWGEKRMNEVGKAGNNMR